MDQEFQTAQQGNNTGNKSLLHFPREILITHWIFEKYWHNLTAQTGVQISPTDFPGDMTVYLNP